MSINHQSNQQSSNKKTKLWRILSNFVAIIIFVIIGYYLITEHRAHVAGFLASFPWWILLFLLCPLMHFLHGGHGKHKDHHKRENENSSEKKD